MKRVLLVLIPAAALGSLIVWRLKLNASAASTQAVQREQRMKTPPLVGVATVQKRDITHRFEGIGTIESPNAVKVASRLTGLIEYIAAREGDRVTRGQILVRIDPADLNSEVRRMQASLAEAQYRLAQAELNTNPTDVTISTKIREEEAGIASAQADYNQAVKNYDRLKAAGAANVADAQGRIDAAVAAIATADATINSEKARVENARSRFNRLQGLNKEGVVSDQDLDDARTALNVQVAAVEEAKSKKDAAIAQRESAKQQKEAAIQNSEAGKTRQLAEIDSANARLKQAKAALETAKANVAQKPAYRQNLAALRAQVEVARAALHSAESKKADATLLSPLNGFVTTRFVDQGALATPGLPILAVQETRQVWASISMPEEASRRIHTGMKVQVTLDALPGKTFDGPIVQVNPATDPTSRQFIARVLLDNSSNLLKTGMFARATLMTERIARAVVVPREAIQDSDHGPAVVTIDSENKAHKVPVTVGSEDKDYVQITGVQPGDKVVVLSASPVKDGQTVRVDSNKK